MLLKGLIFDMDGTLVDSIPYHRKSWLAFLDKYGINHEKFYADNHGTIGEMIQRLFGNDLSEKEVVSLGEEKEALYREMYEPYVGPIPGLMDFLDKIKEAEVKTAIATMGDEKNIEFTLSQLGLMDYFDCVIGGHMVNRGKPDPEVFELAIGGLELHPSECLSFEDSSGGITSAKGAGTKVVGMTTSHNADELISWGVVHAMNNFEKLTIDLCNNLLNQHDTKSTD